MARGRDVASVANQVEDQPALQIGARVGYAVSGVLHLLIGWIALQVAWFASAKSADQSGALQTISRSPLGRFTLFGIPRPRAVAAGRRPGVADRR